MHISYIQMVDFRLFREARLHLHGELCVFLGDNGSGKTSILDALSLLISRFYPYCNYKPSLRSISYTEDDHRMKEIVSRRKKHTIHSEESGIVCILELDEWEGAERFGYLLSAGKKIKAEEEKASGTAQDLANDLNRRVQSGEEGIPVVAYYGPHRGAAQGARRRFGRRKANYSNPFAAYEKAMNPSLDFESFLEWFSEEQAAESQEQKKDKNYVSQELQAVRNALTCIFSHTEHKLSDPRFEYHPKRFVMTQTLASGEQLDIKFDQLSDGYRSMIALVADFARRLAIANQMTEGNPLEGAGVLMIDEIDAHLHPKWQYRVMDDLRRAFPNVQIIVTTHSAQIASMVEQESVYILNTQDGILEERHPEFQTQGNYPNDIEAEVMQTPELYRENEFFQAYLSCLAAIQQGGIDTEAFDDVLKKVKKHYGENHPITQEVIAKSEGVKRRQKLLLRMKPWSAI